MPMPNQGLQRTLLIGLDPVGAKTVNALLTELTRQLGRLGIMQGLAVLPDQTQAADSLVTIIQISPETAFTAWQADFTRHVEQALRQISHLDNLTCLAQQGLSLGHADEVRIIIVANVAMAWVTQALPEMVATLRQTVTTVLACHASLTGVLLAVKPDGDETAAQETNPLNGGRPVDSLLVEGFDHGCFLAGLTNELGLIIGDADYLIDQTTCFLALLMRQVMLAGLDWEDNGLAAGGWGVPLTSFGLARLTWPGHHLVGPLSLRWTEQLLAHLMTPPPTTGPETDPVHQARQMAQQWLTGEKLPPPLLLDRLAALMPVIPHTLADLTPDPPWPWLLVTIPGELEQAGQRWQQKWLAANGQLNETLAGWQNDWSDQANEWLYRRLAQPAAGVVLRAQAQIAAVTELLQAFVEGLEESLAEAELDLAQAEQQVGWAIQDLAEQMADFPTSPLAALLRWGPHPSAWLNYWHRCRQTQAAARNLAHLSRARLQVWQLVSYYEELLPFYHRLLAGWKKVIVPWEQNCRQIIQAEQELAQINWTGQLEAVLAEAGSPWEVGLALALYQEALDLHHDSIWTQIGTPADWGQARQKAGAITERLCDRTAQLLKPFLTIPADQALCRQFPDEKKRADRLAGLSEQARPFWRYDETSLAESSRAQVRVERWLLLPGGQDSPLAQIGRHWPQPPLVLANPRPEEIVIITVRRIH